jgi:hypothetical protein
MDNQTVALTPAQLSEIVTAAVREATKPSPQEQARLDARIADALEARRSGAQAQREKAEELAELRSVCNHERIDGTPAVALIKCSPGLGFDFFLCQRCRAAVRPDESHRVYAEDIVDADLFKTLTRRTAPAKTDL